MTLERLWMLLLMVPPVLWMICSGHRSRGSSRFVLKAFGAALLLLAFCLPGFVMRESRAAAKVLADALAGLSVPDLKQERDSI